jgi:hypothetical protein
VIRAQTAKLTFAGSIASRSSTRIQTASLNFTGSMRAQTLKILEAAFMFAGTSRRNILFQFAAALIMVSNLRRKTLYAFEAALSFVSGLTPVRSVIIQALRATLELSGQARRNIVQVLRGALSFIGFLPRNDHNKQQAGAVFLRLVRGPDQLTHRIQTHTLTLKMQPIRPDRLVRFKPAANITELSPGTFREDLLSPLAQLYPESGLTLFSIESYLPNDDPTLIKMRNQTVLITYDELSHTVLEVSKSYYDD